MVLFIEIVYTHTYTTHHLSWHSFEDKIVCVMRRALSQTKDASALIQLHLLNGLKVHFRVCYSNLVKMQID